MSEIQNSIDEKIQKQGDSKYISNAFHLVRTNEQYRELEKTRYIKDLRERVEKVRKLTSHDTEGYPNPRTEFDCLNFQELGFNSLEEMTSKIEVGMFSGVWSETYLLRKLEIELYLKAIIDESNLILQNEGERNAIFFLIDKRYIIHKNIFNDPKADVLFKEEYNNLLFDLIGDEIRKISKIEVEPINKSIRTVMQKGLIWNANKQTIGTIFGVLHKHNIIKGSKADIARGLNAMFDNLSESTLLSNLKLDAKNTPEKNSFDPEVERLVLPLINHITQQRSYTKK